MSRREARSTKVRNREPQEIIHSSRPDSLDTDEMAERLRSTLADMARGEPSPTIVKTAPVGAAAVVLLAKRELSLITGLEADRVSSVINEPDGWHVTVDLIELSRIPHSTDVIAAYDAVFSPEGTLLSYHRSRRYLRDQMSEDE